MKPNLFYTIWFSQRNASSLLCEALKSTGIAGLPEEYFQLEPGEDLLQRYRVADYEALRQHLWTVGSTANGVFGIKVNAPRRENDPIIEELKQLQGLPGTEPGHFEVWNNFFPGSKHIFLTRRNKVRQAVSWWKAIASQEWHRMAGQQPGHDPSDLRDRYDFDAIHHLLIECSLREARIQDMLTQAGAIPFTIVYEDFVQRYEETVRELIAFLGIAHNGFEVGAPFYERMADELTEEWTERFRRELQKDWDRMIW